MRNCHLENVRFRKESGLPGPLYSGPGNLLSPEMLNLTLLFRQLFAGTLAVSRASVGHEVVGCCVRGICSIPHALFGHTLSPSVNKVGIMLDSCCTLLHDAKHVFQTHSLDSIELDSFWTRLGLGLTYSLYSFWVNSHIYAGLMLDRCWAPAAGF